MARILICDDAAFMRSVMRETLENAGHTIVAEAEDPLQAIEMYKEHKPDLVTMDILMKASGVEGVKGIRKIDPKAKIVIVSVLTAQEGEVVEAVREGALGIVSKPIKREILLAEVERVLKKS